MSSGGAQSLQRSVYVTMRDSVRIAVELWLPAEVVQGKKVGTIAWFTRYWRASITAEEPSPPRMSLGERVNSAGYAFAHVDVRGSGASFGKRLVEYPDEEVWDSGEIIDWLSKQDWSNGRVATDGISYTGNTAELAAVPNHPALRATTPRFTDFDNYAQIHFPGGLQSTKYLTAWGDFVKALDRNDVSALRTIANMPNLTQTQGIKPVERDEDRSLLREALVQHLDNVYFVDHGGEWLYRNDLGGVARTGEWIPRRPLFTYRKEIEAAHLPMMHWAGWLDSGTADGALARFATFDAPNVTLIGPWNHGALRTAHVYETPSKPVEPSVDEQWQEVFAFLGRYLDEASAHESAPRCVRYFTMGEDRWKTTDVWPPENIEYRTYYFSGDQHLVPTHPRPTDEFDVYAVKFSVGSGKSTRWTTSFGGTDVHYPDRGEVDRQLLCYTSAPLEEDLEITGHPIVRLFASSTHEDGAFIVYLETLAPDGKVVYLTEGMLRAIHRKISQEPPPYETFGPYHSYLSKDAMPLVPGEVAELAFKLFPTSVRIPAGHAIRVAIAGHDKDTFVRVPARGRPFINLHRSDPHLSRIELPVAR